MWNEGEEALQQSKRPDAKACEVPGCGAGQPLYETAGMIHCYHHRTWPASKEGARAAKLKQIDKE